MAHPHAGAPGNAPCKAARPAGDPGAVPEEYPRVEAAFRRAGDLRLSLRPGEERPEAHTSHHGRGPAEAQGRRRGGGGGNLPKGIDSSEGMQTTEARGGREARERVKTRSVARAEAEGKPPPPVGPPPDGRAG